ncbi:unnamed protein product [Paramecium sonneborni]|uniref:G domain-containing protein n=1 Tax=Paramecium sonneborni TaxID=65129 RepID=A0A8S1R1B9_9CILI|nr:unnamed protein product [Paramecium sonneborni]
MSENQKSKQISCCQRITEIFKRPSKIIQSQPIQSQQDQQEQQVIQGNQNQNDWLMIEEQFLNKISSAGRRQMFYDLFQKTGIKTIELLILSFKNSNTSFIGKRCIQAELLILRNMYERFNQQPKELQWTFASATLISDNDIQIQQQSNARIKNILLVGITGQGKTTLINSFYNHISKITLDSNLRYLVIDDNEQNREGKSVTREVNQYKIKIKDDLIFNFIDTPGLGDTEGYSRDQEIIDQISKQIKKMKDKNQIIHQVIIVSQLSTNYVVENTPTLQQLALLNVLKLFGIDMAQHYIHALTFSDFTTIHRNNFENPNSIFFVLTQRDQLLLTRNFQQLNQKSNNLLTQSPTNSETAVLLSNNQLNENNKEFCQFQNSVYYQNLSNQISLIQFRKNTENYIKFIEKISFSEGFQLDTTIQVIEERIRLKNQIEILGQELQLRVRIDQLIQSNKRKIENYQSIAQENQNFSYIEFEPIKRIKQCSQNIYMTNCQDCKKTCHKNCSVSNQNLINCNMMIRLSSGNYVCESCQHTVEKHLNENIQYIQEVIEVERFYDDMRNEHNQAITMTQKLEQILQEQIQREIDNDARIILILDDLKNCFNYLFSSALYKLDLREKSLKDFLYKYFKSFENQLEKYFRESIDIFATRRLVENQQLNQQNTMFRLRTENFQRIE